MSQQGTALQNKIRQELDQMRDTVSGLGFGASGRRPKVMFLLAHGAAPQVAGTGTAAHAMIELAGAENAFASFSGYKPLTAEGAITGAPDVILISDQGFEAQGGMDGVLKRPGLALTPAGLAKRIVKMDALELLGMGPRLPQTVVTLAKLLRN